MKRTVFLLLFAFSLLPVWGKHSGDYLNNISELYVTPHYVFGNSSANRKLNVLFIISRPGARDAVELVQRMPMNAEYFLTYNAQKFAAEDMYESAMEGTSNYEKNRELTEKLSKIYDLCVIGYFDFMKLPESAQFRILSRVTQGMGLVLIHPLRVAVLPYKKLYIKPLEIPEMLKTFAQPSPKMKLSSWQVGKGKLVSLSWGGPGVSEECSTLPILTYNNQWKTKHENAAAFVCAVMRYAAGVETTPEHPVIRVRDRWNNIVEKNSDMPSGIYYRDKIGTNGAFHISEFSVSSKLGKVSVSLPDTALQKKLLNGLFTVERSSKKTLDLKVELFDSPYGRIWYRQIVAMAANTKKCHFKLENIFMPTLAGYCRVTAIEAGKPLAVAEQVIFFPDSSLDDYVQLGWDTLRGNNGELLAPQLVDRLGWNYGLTHPKPEGRNIRDMALLNQKLVAYTARIMMRKAPAGGVYQPNVFFLNGEQRKKYMALDKDECFYRPEVRQLWAEGIAFRVKNLAKYSTAIYSLGDENELDLDAGYGPSDLYWFRQFLKYKYKNIQALNDTYQSNYLSFDEVPHTPLKEAKESGNYPAWADHRFYMEKMYADFHSFLRDEIRKHDPQAKVGAEGSVPGDLEKTIEHLEYWGPYSSLLDDELLRSLGNNKIRMLWWGGYPSSHSGRSEYPFPLLKDLLLGTVNGNAWYSSRVGDNHSVFSCDMTIAPYAKKFLPDLDRMKEGSAQLLIRNSMANNGMSIYWSHASKTAAQATSQCINPQDGILPLIRSAYRLGVGFEFVTAKTLNRLKKCKVLFLCGASALSDVECNAIIKFVSQGGIVIADSMPAIMNENLKIRKCNPLSKLFGNTIFATIKPGNFGKLRIFDLEAERVLFYSAKPMEERNYQKGKAIICNFSLTSASNTVKNYAQFDQWLLLLLKKGDAAPKFKAHQIGENTIFRVRENSDFTLLGVMAQLKDMKKELAISFPKKYFVYKVDYGLMGKSDNVKVEFKKSPLQLYTLFDCEQKAPEFKIAPLARGEMIQMKLPTPCHGRVLRLELFDPAGKKMFTWIFDRQEKFPKRAIAYNEPQGTWAAKLTDVATGLSKKFNFEVK